MDINILVLFFLGLAWLYGLGLMLLAYFSRFHQKEVLNTGDACIPVTVLVPFRNERDNLPGLLASLGQLSYPLLEVILIDDHSEDGGAEYAKGHLEKKGKKDWRVVSNPGLGKKAAITYGVSLSTGEVILTTDADCTFPEDWVHEMVVPFSDVGVRMVCGPVMIASAKNCLGYFQQVEWSSILLVTRFFYGVQRPVMCSAANMGYRKEAFQYVGGYKGNENCLTGDDVFLLEKMVRFFGPGSTRCLGQKEALVWTFPTKSWKQFFQQRIRWASKWNLQKEQANLFTALLCFLWAGVGGASFLLLFLPGQFPYLFAGFWLIKIAAEWVVLGRILVGYKIKIPFWGFLLTGLLHPFYVLGVGLGAWRGKYTWKGRESFLNA